MSRARSTSPSAAPEAGTAPGIAALDERGLDALIERVEEAIEHDLALSGADLSLLLEALVTLAAVTERLEHKDLTIAKLEKLLGIGVPQQCGWSLAGADFAV